MTQTLSLALIALAAAGCISAPAVVVLDHRTALELQAGGEYRGLERDLTEAALSPKAEDIPGEKLGGPAGPGALGTLAALSHRAADDGAQIDRLLVGGCLAEGRDGLLLVTAATCPPEVDRAETAHLAERANLLRQQLWRALGRLAGGKGEAEVRAAWQRRNLERIICGAKVQRADGTFEAKPC